jgi:hypothetical protein
MMLDKIEAVDEAVFEIYRKMRPSSPPRKSGKTFNSSFSTLLPMIFPPLAG